jgi:hypothetical protein
MFFANSSAMKRLIFVILIRHLIPSAITIRFTTTSAAKTALEKQAFVDTWTWDDHANECFDQILTNKNGVQTAQSIALINGLEKVLGKGALFAYLVSMTVRIAEIHRFESIVRQPLGIFSGYICCANKYV